MSFTWGTAARAMTGSSGLDRTAATGWTSNYTTCRTDRLDWRNVPLARMVKVSVCPMSGSLAVTVPTAEPLRLFSWTEKVAGRATGGSFSNLYSRCNSGGHRVDRKLFDVVVRFGDPLSRTGDDQCQ